MTPIAEALALADSAHKWADVTVSSNWPLSQQLSKFEVCIRSLVADIEERDRLVLDCRAIISRQVDDVKKLCFQNTELRAQLAQADQDCEIIGRQNVEFAEENDRLTIHRDDLAIEAGELRSDIDQLRAQLADTEQALRETATNAAVEANAVVDLEGQLAHKQWELEQCIRKANEASRLIGDRCEQLEEQLAQERQEKIEAENGAKDLWLQLAQVREDAERYRALRLQNRTLLPRIHPPEDFGCTMAYSTPEAIDAAVDAALAQAVEGEKPILCALCGHIHTGGC